MLKIYNRYPNDGEPTDDVLVLPYELRQKGRLKAVTDAGVDVGLFLERGNPLKDGELLISECGTRVGVKAADEPVTTATGKSWQVFSKVCYHLGNRHVPLQVGELWLRFKPDHVLEELAVSFGLEITREQAPFEPESGAYANRSHHHEDHHHHGHNHSHG